jgi:hypothetical protein
MATKMIVLRAAPSVRVLCPDSYLEGEWREVPDHVTEVAMYANLPLEDRDAAMEAESPTLIARDCGRMVRRDDGVTAPVWEVRRPEDWPKEFNFFRS